LDTDRDHLAHAVELALDAARAGEYPIGAVLVAPDGVVIGSAANAIISSGSRLQHAEVRILSQLRPYSAGLRDQRLTLYSSLEPCLMCFGAAVIAGIRRIVWACSDPFGGAGVLTERWPLPHLPIPEIVAEPYGDLRDASCAALVDFFVRQGRDDILTVWQKAGYGD
jgi:tRNA(adenine34) deaminase